VATVVLAAGVAGCSSTPAASPTTTGTPATTADSLAPPAACTAGGGGQSLYDVGPIGQAVAAVPLAAGVTLLGTQVIDSARQPGTSEVVIRVCSNEMSERQLAEIGGPLAEAARGAGVPVTLVKISLWVPEGDTIDQALSVDL